MRCSSTMCDASNLDQTIGTDPPVPSSRQIQSTAGEVTTTWGASWVFVQRRILGAAPSDELEVVA